MIASRSTGIDVSPFNQNAGNPAKGQIPGSSRAGSSSPDNQDLGFMSFHQ
jgi:hypothetical protein